jgi:hypothetical protein
MPFDTAPIAAWLEKPGDPRDPVADRDQRHSTVPAATQANARDLAKRNVDHAAHSKPVLVRLTTFHHEKRFPCRHKQAPPTFTGRITNEALPQTDEVYAEDGALIVIANDRWTPIEPAGTMP